MRSMMMVMAVATLLGWSSAGVAEQPRPLPPIEAALDANSDGVVDDGEIANAPEALLALDKDGDGQLSMDEVRPPRPDCKATAPMGPPPEE